MKATKTIMLVEDDPDDQFIFTHALLEVFPSVSCLCVDNAEQALQSLHQEDAKNPDYLFLDLNLPLMDGLTFLKKIKSEIALKDIPVAIYSTSSRLTDKEKAKELGAQHYIQKPSTFNELSDVMQNIFPVLL
jgi:CheY-like chemotaxis protein